MAISSGVWKATSVIALPYLVVQPNIASKRRDSSNCPTKSNLELMELACLGTLSAETLQYPQPNKFVDIQV